MQLWVQWVSKQYLGLTPGTELRDYFLAGVEGICCSKY